MKKAIFYLLLGVLASVVQGSLLHMGMPVAVVPQLIVVLIIALAFTEVSTFGCVMAFSLGLVMDFSSAVLVGPWAGALVLVFGTLAVLSQRLFIESGIAAMVITFLAVVGANILFSLFGTEYPSMTWEYPKQILGQAMVTALVAPFLLGKLTKRGRRHSSVAHGRRQALSAV